MSQTNPASEQVEQNAALVFELLDLAPVLAYDMEGRIVFWTSGDKALYGWSKAEVSGRKAHDLLQTACAEPLTEINAAVWARGTWEGVLVRTDKAGRQITLASRWILHRNDAGEPEAILEVSKDITELKRTELDLFYSRTDLEQRALDLERTIERTAKLYEMIGELEAFSYSIAHDLRAPLRAIHGYAEVLQQDSRGPISAEAARILGLIMGAAQRMDCLIQDVLALSRLSRADLKLETVNPQQLLQDIIDSCAALQTPLAEIHMRPSFPAMIGNPIALTQCISNLLNNAVKFVAPGVVPRVDIWAEQKGGLVRLWFADNGIGIAAQHQHKIFGIFHRVNSAYEGTGLGLAIVSRAALRMGGKVGVESELGKGSRFWLELPASPA
jgi:PAS domain S-box-containing protein